MIHRCIMAGEEVNPPEGYEVENGYGTKQNPAIGIQYARTDNIDIDGVQNGDYEGGIDTTKVYTVPGASTLNIKMMSDVTDGDYVVLWSGSHTDYTAVNDSDKGIKIVKKNDETYEINDNAVTIGFHSEPGEKKSFGYYAEISGNNNASGLTATNVSTEEPALDVGNLCIKKQVLEADGSPSTDDKIFKFNIELSSDDDKISVMLVNKKNYGDVTIEGGKGSFYLSNGGNVNLTGIPAGVKYHITEDATDGYESVLTNEDGTIQKNKTATVTCTNTRKTQPEVKKQTLTIKKIVKNGDNKDNFTFHISFSNLEKNVKYKYKKGDAETAFASDKDGTADVTFMLANNENVVFENIPENTKYQVTEDANKYYASYEITDAVKTVQQKKANEQADQSLSTGTETVDADENAAVIFTNTGKEPDVPKTEKLKIRIKKIWNDNEDAGNTRPGNITVYLMQDENIIKNIELNADNGWEAEVDGLEVLKEDGKTEYKYSVNEENVSGYDSNVVESEETDAAGDGGKVKVFTITNTKTETGSLKVSKTVEGNCADRNKAFKFKVELKNGGNPVSGVYPLDGTAGSKTGTIVFDENGMASFELSDGESIVITGLPVGADYTVTENAYKDYKPSDNGKYNGKIEAGKTGEISVVNTYDEKYDISVSKTVKGNQGDKSKNFEFVLKLTGSNGLVVPGSVDVEKNGNFETMKVIDGEVKFTLSHGEKIIFKKLPAGVKYEVTETVTDGYKMTCDNNSGVLRTNADIGFVNTKNVGIPTAAMTNTGIITAIAVCCGGVIIAAIVRAVKKKKK